MSFSSLHNPNYSIIRNAKAWMTRVVFKHEMEYLNEILRKESRHFLMLLDNANGHDPTLKLSNISFRFLLKNVTRNVSILYNVALFYSVVFIVLTIFK